MSYFSKNKASLTDLILERNKDFANEYQKNGLMQLVKSPLIENRLTAESLLDAIQVLSDYFQKVVMLRNVLCDNSYILAITTQHLNEEFGHNQSLLKDRNNRPPVWDPILEATSSWFVWKMFTLDNDQKSVLIHLVLESSANIFFTAAFQIMNKHYDTDYFIKHANLDEGHEEMGIELIRGVSLQRKADLFLIQEQGWEMMNQACNRIAQLAIENSTPISKVAPKLKNKDVHPIKKMSVN